MSEPFSDAISTDDTPAPDADDARRDLLGDPETEANPAAYGGADQHGHDDIAGDLATVDEQN